MLNPSMRRFWIYILASQPRGTLYVGVTSDLVRRVQEHREGLVDGFTKEHSVKMLVHYEEYATAIEAIQREKNLKHWPRKWKLDLVRSSNPEWSDLWEVISR
jgi:putative endonuclease